MKLTKIVTICFELLTVKEKEKFKFKRREEEELIVSRLNDFVSFLTKDAFWHVEPIEGSESLQFLAMTSMIEKDSPGHKARYLEAAKWKYYGHSLIFFDLQNRKLNTYSQLLEEHYAGHIKGGIIYAAHPELIRVLEQYEFR